MEADEHPDLATPPAIHSDAETDPEAFDHALESRARWKAMTELAERSSELKIEGKALRSEDYSYRHLVRKGQLDNLAATVKQIDDALLAEG